MADEQVRIQRLAAWGLRGVAVLTLLGAAFAAVAFWTLAARIWPTAAWPAATLTGFVLLSLLFAAAVGAWSVLLWRRARAMAGLITPDYPAITCFAVCLRLAGELMAILSVLFSLALSVSSLSWAGPLVDAVLTTLGTETATTREVTYAVAAGLALLWPAAGLFAAAFFLFGFYLFAEGLTAMLEYVRDVRRIRERLEGARVLEGDLSRPNNQPSS